MSDNPLEHARGDVIAEKYEVIDALGRSPLGASYRVKHLKTGKYVRLLVLDPQVARHDDPQLAAAVQRARQIEHRNLLELGELGEHLGHAYVTEEDFDGRTLRELIGAYRSENQPFTLREAAQIAIGTLEAARAMHDHDIVFRALRPEHLLVNSRRTGPGGKTVIVEVRAAHAGLWSLVPTGRLAEEEFSHGEAQYIAPELKSFDPSPTPRSDVYSVGVIFYEMLVGSAPVGTYQLPRQRRPDLPAAIDDVVELALAPSPEDRYPTAQDFISGIQRSFQVGSEQAEEGSAAISWLGVGLGVALVFAVVVLLYRQSATDPFQAALDADNLQRKELYDQHERPPSAEIRDLLADHPPNMAYVPPGPFVRGKLRHEAADIVGPTAEVAELEGFLIDVMEYPNLKNGAPKYKVTWKQAEELCAVQGKRLCTADEFEKACKGPQNYVYGYGDTFDADFCGPGIDEPHLSGQLPECKSGWGVYDIAGNFREWTSTEKSGSSSRRLLKGGLPQSAELGTRCAFSTDLNASFADETISFRCCRDLDAGEWKPPVDVEGGEMKTPEFYPEDAKPE